MRTVLGWIRGPVFSRVVVRPHLGKLNFVAGTVPHQRARSVRVDAAGAVSIATPVPGEFLWRYERESRSANQFTVWGGPGASHRESSSDPRLRMRSGQAHGPVHTAVNRPFAKIPLQHAGHHLLAILWIRKRGFHLRREHRRFLSS
jgi:hypothetical protein